MTADRADTASDDGDALLARLDLIEAQPLAERADAYAQLHEVLQAQLEGSDRLRDD